MAVLAKKPQRNSIESAIRTLSRKGVTIRVSSSGALSVDPAEYLSVIGHQFSGESLIARAKPPQQRRK